MSNYLNLLREHGCFSICDKNGKILECSDSLAFMFQYTKEELLQKNQEDLIIESSTVFDLKKILKYANGEQWHGVLKSKKSTEEIIYVDTTIIPLDNDYLIIRKDVTNFIKLAEIDTITGLENEKALKEYIQLRSSSKKVFFILATIDINSFSNINELYGKPFGNETLKAVARYLRTTYSDFKVFRMQSDQFSIIRVLTDEEAGNFREEEVELIKYGLHKIFSSHLSVNNKEIVVHVTAGITIHNNEEIIKFSDDALKIARELNKKSYYLEDFEHCKSEKQKNAEIINSLVYALNHNGIKLAFQPIINNLTDKIEKYETLVRLEKDGILLPPSAFLSIAKKTKMYSALTRRVIALAFEKFMHSDHKFSVNISIEDIQNEKTRDFLKIMLSNYSHPQNVTLEIVESGHIKDIETFNEFAREINEIGASVSIDDFGSGYSNLAYLTRIRFDYLKFDGSLIRNIATNESDYELLKTIVSFTKKQNIKTIAEFVENEEILNLVKEAQIDFSQGYYFSKPLKDDEIFVTKQRS